MAFAKSASQERQTSTVATTTVAFGLAGFALRLLNVVSGVATLIAGNQLTVMISNVFIPRLSVEGIAAFMRTVAELVGPVMWVTRTRALHLG
jgi:hypothetical protein